jgi:hypothetical protein
VVSHMQSYAESSGTKVAMVNPVIKREEGKLRQDELTAGMRVMVFLKSRVNRRKSQSRERRERLRSLYLAMA